MGLWTDVARLARRAARVLELAETLLAQRVGEPVDPALLERHRAFRWDPEAGLRPIEAPQLFELHDLVGVAHNVERLVGNTEQLLQGLPCNHVLLYGDRGTGKSSAVRGLLARFGDHGLRLVEVQKEDLAHLPRVLEAIRGAAHLRFLVFCDDLSFGAGESGFRELKAALEGSLEAPPAHVRIVATSNRRHLLPETMAENRQARVDEDGELRIGEALDEKLALSDRFGLALGFFAFDQSTYLAVVAHYLEQADLGLSPEEVRADALRWALERASRSGRTAHQFVTDLAGRQRAGAARVGDTGTA